MLSPSCTNVKPPIDDFLATVLSRLQISPGRVLCSDTGHYCAFVNIYTVYEPSRSVWNCRQLRARGMIQFSIFVTSLRTLSSYLLLSLAQGASRCIIQRNWMTWCYKQLHETVSFQVAVPVLGETWPRVALPIW